MGKFIDITGKVFGRLTVLKFSHRDNHRNSYWLCQCSCGKQLTVLKSNLTGGKTLSCGCFRSEQNSLNNQLCKDKERVCLYQKWANMKKRCYDSKNPGYKNYGGRGIKICDEWKDNFDLFLNWAKNNGYKLGLTIDRINVNGNYEPGNCRFISIKEQANNKTTNRIINCNGITKTLAEWAEFFKVDSHFIRNKVKKGLTFEKVINNLYEEYNKC